MLGRPYSFVNPPHARRTSSTTSSLPDGPLSPRLATLAAGRRRCGCCRARTASFSISEVPEADALWCIATGTGIGPFLSILRTDEPWQKFARVVLVHATRYANELTYRDEIAAIGRARPGAFSYVPMVSREVAPGALAGRIPAAIEDGRLEARAGVPLTAANAHAMLCGNPAMIEDTQQTLATRGMRRHRRREPGHVTLETYW